MDRDVDHLITNFELLFHCTAFDGWPAEQFESDLRGLLAAGPSSVGWMVAPTGRALGYLLEGTTDDDAFVSAVVENVESLFGPPAAGVVEGLAGWPEPRAIGVEHVFGDPGWYRVGVSFDTFYDLGDALAAMNASQETIDGALCHHGTGGASPEGFDLFVQGDRQWTFEVGTEFESAPGDGLAGAAAGDGPVVVYETVRDWASTWIRRRGMAGEELIDWQDDHGLGSAAAGRVGEVHGTLGVDGPDLATWERGALPDTLVYAYLDPVG